MLAHTCAHVFCVCRQVPTGILGTVRACKHVLRVLEGSRNGCGICQACLCQATTVGRKKSLGVEDISIFTGVGRTDVRKRRPGGEEDVSIITETASFLKKTDSLNLKEKIQASSKAAKLFMEKTQLANLRKRFQYIEFPA